MAQVRPSELELQVLGVLWDRGPSPVRAVLEAMPDGKDRAYTTILSVMQVMEKKGLVRHTQQGPAHIYHATAARPGAAAVDEGPVAQRLRRQRGAGVQRLIDGASLPEGELDEIRRVIEEAERKGGSEPGGEG